MSIRVILLQLLSFMQDFFCSGRIYNYHNKFVITAFVFCSFERRTEQWGDCSDQHKGI